MRSSHDNFSIVEQRSLCLRAMITPVSPRLAMLIHISTSCWTICRSFEIILEMGTVRWIALQIQRSIQIHCFKKHSVRFELCFKIYFIASGGFRVGGPEAKLKRGAFWWRYHTQPTVIITFDMPKIRPPKYMFLRLRHNWNSRRRKYKRVFMMHNFENTENWEDKAGNT